MAHAATDTEVQFDHLLIWESPGRFALAHAPEGDALVLAETVGILPTPEENRALKDYLAGYRQVGGLDDYDRIVSVWEKV